MSTSSNIRRLRNGLCNMIDVENGFLDKLRQKAVLNDHDTEQINNELNVVSKTNKLLDIAIDMTVQQQKLFLLALFETGQVHVNNYIISNGHRQSQNENRWPLYNSEEYDLLAATCREMIEILDTDTGLLDELLAVQCITVRHKEKIDVCNTPAGKNEELLNIMWKRSVFDFYSFVRSLKRTKQYEAASLLESNSDENDQPLSGELKKILLANHLVLSKLIDTQCDNTVNGLTTLLVEENCITEGHRQVIRAASGSEKRSSRLLTIVRRGSQRDFEKFLDCLGRSHQEYLRCVMEENGTVAHVVVTLRDAASIMYKRSRRFRQREISPIYMSLVVKSLMLFLQNNFCDNVRSKPLMSNLITLHKDVQLVKEVQLVAADGESCIGLYYLCRSLSGLQHLNEMCISEQLCLMLDEVILTLPGVGKSAVVDCVRWDESNFDRCAQHMHYLEGLHVLADLYSWAQERLYVNKRPAAYSCEQFPNEVTEILLIKSTGSLFEIFNITVQSAEVYSLATLCAVCRIWWLTLIHRKSVRRSILRCFKRVCRPCTSTPCTQHTLDCQRNVAGVAALDGKLYVVTEFQIVRVFADSRPFSRLADIVVRNMQGPSDIVACIDTFQLYIADYKARNIWQMDVSSDKHEVGTFASTEFQPSCLSTRFRRLLVVSSDGRRFFIYYGNGDLLKCIELPKYLTATHAVETARNTYLVSHYGRQSADMHQTWEGVSEVDVNGSVIRGFNTQHQVDGSIQFSLPVHLALNDSNFVFVGDCLNKRIVVLNDDLQLKRVLINSLDGQPWRLCFSRPNLFLITRFSRSVHIYKVLSNT